MLRVLLSASIFLMPFIYFSQGGPECSLMEPICTNVGLDFTANSGVAEASITDPGNDYDCLFTQPNPSWYYFEIATSGNINMQLQAASDIDFVIWGPFSSLSAAQAQCGDLGTPVAEIVDCSYSPTNNEFPVIPGAVVGQVYVMLITNYADVVQDVTLTQISGSGSTDCSIITAPPCAMTDLSVSVSGCEFATNTYDVSGTISFTDAPATGNLVVVGCNGVPQTVASAPFGAGPINFAINNLAANGAACSVTAYFTADPTCTQTFNYTAPLCLPNCPTYELQSFSPTEACGNQLYSLEVQNSGCDGYVEFNVVGNWGSLYGGELSWQVTSNLTGNIVAAGGPGISGVSFNIPTGQLNPGVQGYIYTLEICDNSFWGDGFNGSGGFITIQVDGTNIITPITSFTGCSTIMFQAPLVVSTSTMTVLTPSGPVSSVMGNCQDHEVQFTLANTNFCSPVEIDLPWTIVCDNSGTVIASGTHTVVVYPQVPDQSSDLVSITWNTSTCQWDVSPNNDCNDLDIGTIFSITPDPSTLDYCTNGNQNFTVNYNGVPGSPNCCATAGPQTAITYSETDTKPEATVTNSPFGGVNNSAYIEIPANGTGGNATSVTLTVSYNGYCENISSTTGDNFWVTVYVDGFIIYDQQQTTNNFTQTFTLANMPFGYNENSVVEVYFYPNQLGSTVYAPGTPCGSLPSNYWNVSGLNVSLNATFEQTNGTPVTCILPTSSAYTCCTVTPLSANPPANIAVACPSAVPAPNIASVTGIVSDCPTVVTHISDVPTGSCPSSIARTYRVTDACGDFINVVQTITINPPVVIIPANGSNSVNCPANAVLPTPAAVTDNCGRNVPATFVSSTPLPTCEGTVTYNFVYTDCQGVTYPWSYVYTIDHSASPAQVGVPVASSSTVSCITAATPPAALPVVQDVCGNVLIPTGPTVGGTFAGCEGTVTYTYNYVDCAGLPFSWTYTYTVDRPALTMPYANGGATVNCPTDAVNPGAPGVVTDACGNVLTPVVTAPSTVGCTGGTMDWIYTYTDCAGSIVTWTYAYTVDMAPFSIAVLDGASTVNCVTAAQIQPTPPTAQDLCGNAIIPVVTAPGAVTCEGQMTWVFTYTDCAGNSDTWNYVYTVDIPPFTISTANGASTVNCITAAQVQPTPPTVQDGCGNILTPNIIVPADISCEGDMIWTFNYVDCSGNLATWLYTYSLEQLAFTIPFANESSLVSCPADATDPGEPGVVTDACGNTLSPIVSLATAPNCDGGAADWVYVYTDCAGNTSNWVYTYNVTLSSFFIADADGTSTVTCAADAQLQPTAPTVQDACGNILTPVVTPPSVVACEGPMTWVFTYTDCAGNTDTWNYVYTVDVPAFSISFADGSGTVSCPADAVDPGAPGVVTDGCGNTLTPVVTAPSLVGCNGGTMDWVYIYTDCSGNTDTWTYSYTVNMGAFTLPFADAGSTVACLADAQVQPVPPVAVLDLCGNTITPVVTVPADVACEGVMDWVFTYTDCAGNSLDWTYTYTVDYSGTLTLPANGNSVVQCPADVVDPAAPASLTDACGNTVLPVLIGTVSTPDPIVCAATVVYTYQYQTCDGTTYDWTYTYVVNDDNDPTADTPSSINVECAADVPSPDPSVVPNVADNCTTPVVAWVSDVSDNGSCLEIIARTYSVTDACGNQILVTQTITIQDVTAPNGTAPGDVMITDPAAIPAPNVNEVTNVSDNCSTPTVIWMGDVSDGGECPEVITRTYQITDECGNSISVSQVITIDAKCDIVIPSAFTPNGDSENDEWEIIDLDLVYPNNIVYVYNRWGNLIYTSNKGDYASKKWDGTYNEEVLPVASYYYIIFTEGDNSGDKIQGTVSIIKK